MDKFYIKGQEKIGGKVSISSSKNSTLPIMAACLLSKGQIQLRELPNLRDVNTMKRLLSDMGVSVNNDVFCAKDILKTEANYELVKTMRASVLVLGPLLSRFGVAKVSLPGGCAIGSRPVDIHLKGLEKMGAKITVEGGYIHAEASELKGCEILLDFPSVGATENLLMASVFASGQTVIKNCALEPEIADLCHFLMKMFSGLHIHGIGTSTIRIEGISKNSESLDISYKPISDRIEAATFVIAGVMNNTELKVENCIPEHFGVVTQLLQKIGANITTDGTSTIIKPSSKKLQSFNVKTAPYPLFPTDVQAQLMSLATVIEGKSLVTENIFENRFMHVPEINRMGAKISIDGNLAIVQGGYDLCAAPVMCTDLRASAALVLCAMVANGETEIRRVYHMDRGYDQIDQKLKSIGVNIKRVNDNQLNL